MNPASRACAARSPLRASGPSSAIAARPARKSISTPIIPGHSELRAGPLLQAPVLAVDQAAFDQPASDLLRAAQPGLEQISPAAAHPPQAHPGPVTGEDRLPVAGDEFIPPQQFHLEGIVAVHDLTVRQHTMAGPPHRRAAGHLTRTPWHRARRRQPLPALVTLWHHESSAPLGVG